MNDISKAGLMASHADQVIQAMTVADLGEFKAYANGAIKVVFQDRTIVRLMKDCPIIRVLTRRGDELLFNFNHPNPAQKEYQDYIQVAQEFFDHCFLS